MPYFCSIDSSYPADVISAFSRVIGARTIDRGQTGGCKLSSIPIFLYTCNTTQWIGKCLVRTLAIGGLTERRDAQAWHSAITLRRAYWGPRVKPVNVCVRCRSCLLEFSFSMSQSGRP